MINADYMQTFDHRALTAGEIALGQGIYGDEIDWRRVRVRQVPPLGFWAMVPLGRTILFSRLRAARDFTTATLGEQRVFIHELAHVWQAAHGTVLALAKFGALGKGAYIYKLRKGARWRDYNIESQAEITSDLFMAKAGKGPHHVTREWLEEVWASR